MPSRERRLGGWMGAGPRALRGTYREEEDANAVLWVPLLGCCACSAWASPKSPLLYVYTV